MFAATVRCNPQSRRCLPKARAIDVLVNNAGVNYTAAVEDLSMEGWRAQFETNFFGVLRVTRALLPQIASGAAAAS